MPSVSLVIATYNRGPKIASTIDTALNQTRPADEVIVVDDSSTDGTGEWVHTNFPSVRVIRAQRNGGTSRSRNLGVEAAIGDKIVFLDHDDELLPHAIEVLERNLEKWPEVKASFADHRYINTQTHVCLENHHTEQVSFHRLQKVRVISQSATVRCYGTELHRALLHGNLLQQPWMIERKAFLDLGGFSPDVRFCEDWDIYLRVTARYRVVLTDEVISNHIVEGNNLHLAPGQGEMHARVIKRQLRARSLLDWTAYWTLRRRLGMCYKCLGDEVHKASKWRAWTQYRKSFAAWPFDHVVAARTALWLPGAIVAKLRESGRGTQRD